MIHTVRPQTLPPERDATLLVKVVSPVMLRLVNSAKIAP